MYSSSKIDAPSLSLYDINTYTGEENSKIDNSSEDKPVVIDLKLLEDISEFYINNSAGGDYHAAGTSVEFTGFADVDLGDTTSDGTLPLASEHDDEDQENTYKDPYNGRFIFKNINNFRLINILDTIIEEEAENTDHAKDQDVFIFL